MIDTSIPIYLASKSPRRRKLLKLIYPHVHVLDIATDEEVRPGEAPAEIVKRLASEKMDAAMVKVKKGLVVTADTLVALDGLVLGKPEDEKDAFAMLRRLSGREHHVFTGICIGLMPSGKKLLSFEKTKVVFKELADDEIISYIKSGSPMDKAGSYGIQDDYGAVFVTKITGCYYNVVGLPLAKTHTMIQKVIANAAKN
ncbi:MAG: Maf family protein [Ignavibacteria bacterium]|nr:Maf family protein [Ignavibacteria bacterium]